MLRWIATTTIAAIVTLLTGGPASAAQPAQPAGKEVLESALRYLDACVTRDADYVAANSIDEPEGSFSGFTTGPGPGSDLRDFVDHLKGLKPVKWSGLNPRGFVVGDFAWFTDHAKGIIPSGQPLDIRVTLLMRRVGKDWKVAHFHVSEGVSREGIRLEP